MKKETWVTNWHRQDSHRKVDLSEKNCGKCAHENGGRCSLHQNCKVSVNYGTCDKFE